MKGFSLYMNQIDTEWKNGKWEGSIEICVRTSREIVIISSEMQLEFYVQDILGVSKLKKGRMGVAPLCKSGRE